MFFSLRVSGLLVVLLPLFLSSVPKQHKQIINLSKWLISVITLIKARWVNYFLKDLNLECFNHQSPDRTLHDINAGWSILPVRSGVGGAWLPLGTGSPSLVSSCSSGATRQSVSHLGGVTTYYLQSTSYQLVICHNTTQFLILIPQLVLWHFTLITSNWHYWLGKLSYLIHIQVETAAQYTAEFVYYYE